MEERVLLKVTDPADLGIISELDDMTNERLRQDRGEISITAPEDRVSGTGSQFIMAAFSYTNPDGSRFSDGSYGAYYAARTFQTAIEETKHHTTVFMLRTNEGPMRLERQSLRANLDGNLHSICGRKLPGIYSKTDYSASQALGRRLVKERSYGITYDSVRHEGGECVAVLRPPVLSDCRHASDLIFDWDGKNIAKVHILQEYPGK